MIFIANVWRKFITGLGIRVCYALPRKMLVCLESAQSFAMCSDSCGAKLQGEK